MRGKPYRPYQGRRWGEMLLWVGVLVLAASAVTFLAAPFSIRKFAAFPALGGLFLILFALTARCPAGRGRTLRRALALLFCLRGPCCVSVWPSSGCWKGGSWPARARR